MKRCSYCKRTIDADSKTSYCSEACQTKARETYKRHRQKHPRIVKVSAKKCVICGSPTQDGALYCSRACEIEQQVRTFGAPIADFLIDRGRLIQDTHGQKYAQVLAKHGLYKLAG